METRPLISLSISLISARLILFTGMLSHWVDLSELRRRIAGLAVTYGLDLSVVQGSAIWNLCIMENKIISVERILQYTCIKIGPPLVIEENRPDSSWRSCGKISIQDFKNFLFGMECDSKPAYNYNASLPHSVSVSSMDVVVPESSTMSDISMSHTRPPKGTIDLFSNPPMQVLTQLSPLDREARVMRYREKNRKFEKTIRYASRKAYAETRPRIKGRFAMRTYVEAEVEESLSGSHQHFTYNQPFYCKFMKIHLKDISEFHMFVKPIFGAVLTDEIKGEF